MSIDKKALEAKVKEILSDPSSNGITPKDVRLILEKQFKTEYNLNMVLLSSLVDRKKEIKQIIEKVLSEQGDEPEEEV